jgi:hypothetical protein
LTSAGGGFADSSFDSALSAAASHACTEFFWIAGLRDHVASLIRLIATELTTPQRR